MSVGDLFSAVFPHRTDRLIGTFATFVAMQFLFSCVYYSLYRRRRGNFSFNNEILRGQAAHIETQARKNTRAIEVLEEALQQLKAGAIPETPETEKYLSHLGLASGRRATVTHLSGPPYGGPAGSRLELFDVGGEELLSVSGFEAPGTSWLRVYLNSAHWIEGPKEWTDALTNVLGNAKIQRDNYERRLASLTTAEPDVWSFWDFFYFSTIVQTTVGFGDILPNSTPVRLVVSTQVLAGYALLVVVLNVVLG